MASVATPSINLPAEESPAIPNASDDPGPVLTPFLIVPAIAVMGLLEWWWGNGNRFILLRLGANRGVLVQEGDWQRLFLAPFLHLDLFHLLGNATAWILFGILAECLLTARWTLVIGLLGGFASCGYEVWIGTDYVSCGLSGAAWSLLGALLAIALLGSRTYSKQDRTIAGFGFALFVFCQVGTLLEPWETHRAHGIGLLSGFLLSLPIALGLRRSKVWSIVGGVLAAAIVLWIGVAAATLWIRTQPWGLSTPGTLQALEWPAFGKLIQLEAPLPQVESCRTWYIENDGLELELGDPSLDPVLASVRIFPLADDIPDTDAGLFDEDQVQRSPPRSVTIHGYPFTFYDAVDRNDPKIEYPTWFGVMDGIRVEVYLSVAADANEAWRAYAATFLDRFSTRPE